MDSSMKKDYLFPLLCILLVALSALPMGCDSDKLAMPDLDFCDSLQINAAITYDKDIKVIIDTKCTNNGCHQGIKGDYTTYQGMLVHLDNGKINKYIFELKSMPPESPFLTGQEKDQIKCWLNNDYPEN